jgi:hypothetical protein
VRCEEIFGLGIVVEVLAAASDGHHRQRRYSSVSLTEESCFLLASDIYLYCIRDNQSESTASFSHHLNSA